MRVDFKSMLFKVSFLFLLIQFFSGSNGYSHSDCKKKAPGKRVDKSGDVEAGLLGRIVNSISNEHDTNLLGVPHSVKILPVAYFDFRTGVHAGFWSEIKRKSKTPYLYKFTLQIIASHKNSHKHRLEFEYPNIGVANFGLVLNAEWQRDLETRYFGLGNDSVNNEAFTDKKSSDFIDDEFYLYNLKRPRFSFHLTYALHPNIKLWSGYGYEFVEPQLKGNRITSFLGRDRPFGHLGGTGHRLSFRVTWDTRSDVKFPSSGFLTEFSFEPNFASVTQIDRIALTTTKSKRVDYYRYTFSNANFFQIICNRLILANRFAFEAVSGNAPYYALGEMPGLRNTRVVGGSTSLRGFQSRRFQDKVKLITLTELRLNATQFSFLGQDIDLIFVSFFDTGRVWRRLSDVEFRGFHTTVGGGIWIQWRHSFIARFEVGRSQEQIIPYLRLRTAF